VLPLWDENPTRRFPAVTIALIAICVAVHLFVQPQATDGDGVRFGYEWAAIPCEITEGRPLSVDEVLVTLQTGDATACDLAGDTSPPVFPDKNVWLAALVSMFLHAGLLHLAGNMLFLWVFGNNVEDHLGPVRFALFYVAAGIVATAAHIAVQLDSTVPVVGASGAIAGVMGAYLVWFPWARVRTVVILGIIPLPFRLPAAVPLAFWFVTQFFVGAEDGIAWMAHVGGFAFGALVGLFARTSPTFNRRLWVDKHRVLLGAGPRGPGGRWDNRRGGWA
jgi:membrane associated rhomboid family serine protease